MIHAPPLHASAFPNAHPPPEFAAASPAGGTHRLLAVSHRNPFAHALESAQVSRHRAPPHRNGVQSFWLPSGLVTV